MKSQQRTLIYLVLLVPFTTILALVTGSADKGVLDLLHYLAGSSDSLSTAIFELRAGRALSAFIVGGLLATAGSLLQVLLRNPLAEPYILGISGGAGVATLAGLILGISSTWTPLAAFAGALISTVLVFAISFSNGNWKTERLLLTGIIIAAGWSALISFLLTLSSQEHVKGMLFWLMGDLSQSANNVPALVLMAIAVISSWGMARALNLLSRGEHQAAALGVNIGMLKVIIFVLAAAMTATAVSMAGSIGFVGLIIPHSLRLLGLRDYRQLLPAGVITGGIFLMLADTLARTILAPQQIPVGIVTAMIGVPIFLALLQRQYGKNSR